MSVWKNGELIVAQGRKRLYWELAKISPSGVTGATGTGLTYSDPELNEIAEKAVRSIDSRPDGLFGVDMAYDKKGSKPYGDQHREILHDASILYRSRAEHAGHIRKTGVL